MLKNKNDNKINLEYLKSILPTFKNGTNKGKIDWVNSIGYTIEFEYNWKDKEIYTGSMCIEDYIKCKRRTKLIISINGIVMEKPIYSDHIINCNLGRYLNFTSSNFRFNINDKFIDNKRELIVIDRVFIEKGDIQPNNIIANQNNKWYKYKCLKCGNEDWMQEGNLISGCSCNACCDTPQKVVLGVNTIWDKAPWMINIVGEEFSKTHMPYSKEIILLECNNCGEIIKTSPHNIMNTKGLSCPICGKKSSYPERIMASILRQLNIKFIKEYSPDYLNRKSSDFYLSDYNLVIEMDGKLGHKDGYYGFNDKTLEECIESDKWKDEQYLKHGIKTIRINCFESNIEYIKNNIFNSELINIFNLNDIDWNKCEEFALNSKVKIICDYWCNHRDINGEDITSTDIAEIFDIDKSMVRQYLKQGAGIGWCNYNPKEEMKRNGKNIYPRKNK